MSLTSVPPMPRLLGLLGLIPFLIGGLGVWVEALGDLRFALPILVLAYGALIASFLGGVRWGAAMQNNKADSQPRHLVMAIVPSLIALVAFMLPITQAFGLLIVLFTAQAVLDVTASDNGDVMAWYKPLRIWLSLIACASMASLMVHGLTH